MITNRPLSRVVWTLAAALMCTATADASQLSNVTVGRFQDFTVVTLFGDAPLTVTHQIIEAKDGKPHRVVVDITGAEHALPANNFSNLPEGTIKSIRTSQFAVSPNPVVRVVMDLAQPAAYRLETPGNNVRVMLSLPGDPPIATVWSASSSKTLASSSDSRVATNPAAGSAVGSKSSSGTMANTSAASDESTASKSATGPATGSKPAKAATSSSTESLELADLSDSNKDMPKVPVPMPRKRSTQKIDFELPKAKATSVLAGASKTDPQPKSALASNPAKASASKSAAASATNKPATSKTVAKAAKDATSKATASAASTRTASVPQTASKKLAKAPAKKTPAKKSRASSSTSEKPSAAKGKSMASALNAAAPTAAKEQKSSAPNSAGAQPVVASEAVASLTTLPPLVKATPQMVPERSKIAYHTGGRRDPFEPLLSVGSGFNSAALPDVGTLRLVGLLHDVKESMGLFEDANGYGYILRKGDRVKNGRLTKLTETRAFFQLSEFGWSRSVQLDLVKQEG